LVRWAADGTVRGPVRPMRGAAGAIAALAGAGLRQSVLTGNVRPLAELKLRRAGLGEHLDLDAGAYGDAHEGRAEPGTVARRAAARPYRGPLDGPAPGPGRGRGAGRRRWTWRPGWPPGPGWWRSRPVAIPRPRWPRPALMSSCRT